MILSFIRKFLCACIACLICIVSPRLSRSQLTEEVKQFKAAAASLQAQIEEAGHKALHLERQLMERGAECRDVASLRRELEDLRAVTHSQEQKVAQSQKEAQQSQTELAGLEAILSLLHLREVGRRLCVVCVLTQFLNQGCAM